MTEIPLTAGNPPFWTMLDEDIHLHTLSSVRLN